MQRSSRKLRKAPRRSCLPRWSNPLKASKRKCMRVLFSEVKDSLSQWRAYGGSSSGYAIGFTGAFLRDVSNKNNFRLVRCIYKPSEQKALVRALLEEVLEENIECRKTEKGNRRGAPGRQSGNIPSSICADFEEHIFRRRPSGALVS